MKKNEVANTTLGLMLTKRLNAYDGYFQTAYDYSKGGDAQT
jgi:hypothetical protein